MSMKIPPPMGKKTNANDKPKTSSLPPLLAPKRRVHRPRFPNRKKKIEIPEEVELAKEEKLPPPKKKKKKKALPKKKTSTRMPDKYPTKPDSFLPDRQEWSERELFLIEWYKEKRQTKGLPNPPFQLNDWTKVISNNYYKSLDTDIERGPSSTATMYCGVQDRLEELFKLVD